MAKYPIAANQSAARAGAVDRHGMRNLLLTARRHRAATILSSSFLRLVLQKRSLVLDFWASAGILGRGTMRQFDVGQVVTCMVRHAAPGNYRIVGLMPDRDGDRMYRIKNPREEYERVVTETLLAKSEGCLPESESYLPEALTQRSRRKITLPTLQGTRPAFLAEATS